MQEQRKYIRYAIEGTVTLRTKGGASSSLQGQLIDISFAGIGMYAPEGMAIGTEVAIELVTKLWPEAVIGEGKVKNVQEIKKQGTKIMRIGIEFVTIDTKVIQCIINSIQQLVCEQARKKEQPKTSPPHPRYF